jgi:crotonobetainyl-CoA:carnitine CoA-transferase CaiB-like acyl-CoA transferase
MVGALDGIRVVEIASYVTGPFASVLLADLGADVVKVEPQEEGDPYRSWGTGGYSPTFCSLNRNKRSVALDLKTADGRSALTELVRTADVLIENHRPGQAERLGIGYEEMRAVNPRLIYCSITGFGADGPMADRPGYDTVGQARSGLLSLLTDLEQPQPMGISLSDHLTGTSACYGVMAALFARERTGVGQRVETSLLQATISFQSENLARFLDNGVVPTRQTRTQIAGVFAMVCGDGLPMVIHLSSPPKFWKGLAAAVERPEWLSDARYESRKARNQNYPALRAELSAILATGTRDHWISTLERHDVPCAPINTLAEVMADAQVEHLGMQRTLVHPQRGDVHLIGPSVTLSGTPIQWRNAPPVLGEHTDEVLAETGRARSTEVIGR